MGPNPIWLESLYKAQHVEDRDTGRRPGAHGGRHGSDGAPNRGTPRGVGPRWKQEEAERILARVPEGAFASSLRHMPHSQRHRKPQPTTSLSSRPLREAVLLGNLGNPAGGVASGAVLGAVSDTILLLLGPKCPVVQPLSLDEKSLT